MNKSNVKLYVCQMRTILILVLMISIQANAQNNHLNKLAEIKKAGVSLPDLPLGKVLDGKYNLSKNLSSQRFTQFKGKLVILDFWGTSCGSCIENFENLSRIQAQFGDKIKIFLVDPIETETEIRERLLKLEARLGKKLVPENLTIIADAKALFKLFPVKAGYSYHVWIDPQGKFKFRGLPENTNGRKIRDYLDGKPISFIKDLNAYPDFKRPLFFNPVSSGSQAVGSIVRPFDEFAYYAYGSAADKIVDSAKKTVKKSYVNMDLNTLFQHAMSLYFSKDSSLLCGRRLLISSIDTGIITQNSDILKRKATDYDLRNRICYEQILPLTVDDPTQFQFMYDDLKRYTSSMLGIKVDVKLTSIECYKLVYIGDADKIRSKIDSASQIMKYINKKSYIVYEGYDAKVLFKGYFQDFYRAGKLRSEDIVIDGTGLKGRIDISLPLPTSTESIEELKEIMKAQGFDLIKGKEEVELLCFDRSI